MSYRDESIVLRERLLSLEAERAKLEGKVAGIRFRTEEAKEEAKRLKRLIALEKAKRGARRASFRAVGIAAGLALLVGTGLTLIFLIHACSNISGTFEASSGLRGEEPLTGCALRLSDPLFSACEARVWCDDGLVFEGPGECRDGPQGEEFWVHGDPSFVFTRGTGRAIYRSGDEVVVLRFSAERR